jgi:hypothetical protein
VTVRSLIRVFCPHLWVFSHTALEGYGMGLEWCHNYRCVICGDEGNHSRHGSSAPRRWFVWRPFGTGTGDWVNGGRSVSQELPPEATCFSAICWPARADHWQGPRFTAGKMDHGPPATGRWWFQGPRAAGDAIEFVKKLVQDRIHERFGLPRSDTYGRLRFIRR